ncbi:hypothetical protein J2W40_002179 [Sphingobium xenophagum]|uniref:Amidoligase enzyme n=1 Tax=Sphingobium xenophagum TaxID=121428 RepID=A0ABU1X1A0_SPHXE|nr:hypothetical protein [Sphingobium xenophagum]MDR7155352.1 hypothetical protein [Sphingobium xenophagum]
MEFSESWRVGFELELVLGDLGDVRFEAFAEDPMDVASTDYCQAVARQLSGFTGKRWLAAQKKQRHNGYFVYPEYDLDPIDWSDGLVAGVELVTPPLRMPDATEVRDQIADWVYEVEGEINTYPNWLSLSSGWHINIDPGNDDRHLDIPKLLLGADELPLLLSSQRLPSKYASPQRHSYGVPLLRYFQSKSARPLLDIDLDNFLMHYGGRGKRYAMNLDKLDSGYLELRHFGSEWFFRGQSLLETLSSFFAAAECTRASHQAREHRLLATFGLLAEWTREIVPSITYGWNEQGHPGINMVHGEIQFDGETLADARWSGTADYVLKLKSGKPGPTIFDQAFTDMPLSLAVLALDVAEIRGRKLGAIPLANSAFSRAVDRLSVALKKAGLIEPPPLEQSVFWTKPPQDQERVGSETGLN